MLFYKQKTAYELRISDWSSDVCSSDLLEAIARTRPQSDRTDTVADRMVQRAQRDNPPRRTQHDRAAAARKAIECHRDRCGGDRAGSLAQSFLQPRRHLDRRGQREQGAVEPLATARAARRREPAFDPSPEPARLGRAPGREQGGTYIYIRAEP